MKATATIGIHKIFHVRDCLRHSTSISLPHALVKDATAALSYERTRSLITMFAAETADAEKTLSAHIRSRLIRATYIGKDLPTYCELRQKSLEI